jgi:tRNA (adenine9-N1/guanine9-N1)-methyltransferase
MILEKIFSEFYKEVTVRNFKNEENLAQKILVKFFLNKKTLYLDEGEVIYENFIKVKYNKDAKNVLEIEKEKIFEKLEKEKKFLIDLSFFGYHSEKGKNSLLMQVKESLNIIREYLFDTNLILINFPKNFLNFLGRNFCKFYERNEFDFSKYNAIILDPYGEEVFEEKDLEKYDLFLIGGIVDVGQRWYYATKYLFEDLNFKRKRIELRGSIRGVPDRINLIIKILLESFYKKIPLEKAIVKNQTRKEIFDRLSLELKRNSSFDEIKEVINVDHKSFNEIYEKLKKVVSKKAN